MATSKAGTTAKKTPGRKTAASTKAPARKTAGGGRVKTPQVEKTIGTEKALEAESRKAAAETQQAEGWEEVDERLDEEPEAEQDPQGRTFVLRMGEAYLSAVAYGGAGKPVPYWSAELSDAKTWKTEKAVRKAAKAFGGEAAEKRLDPVYMVEFAKALD